MITLSNVTIGYPTKIVAHDINATLNSGELTCLLGPNGAGKSTLLKTLAGFLPALSGEIAFTEDMVHSDSRIPSNPRNSNNPSTSPRLLSAVSPNEKARLIAVVLTSHGDLTNMTVRELVAMGRSPYTGFWGKLSQEDNDIVDKAIEDVGISELSHRLANTLSDGERQKVMIAKALAQQTPVIFLDEPTAFLDYPSKVEMMQLLKRLSREQQKIVFLSTHDVEIALQMADRLWIMKRNADADNYKQIVFGSPKELAKSGDIAAFVQHEGVVFDKSTLSIRINT